jgi:hypothetical protein
MAAAFMRRSVATAGLAVLATLASPLAGVAFAAAPALTAGTLTPADGDTVAATRPAVSAAYNTALDHAATQLVIIDTSASNRQISCPSVFNADSTSVGCTPTEDLIDGHVYSTRVHAVNAGDTNDTINDTASWTVDIPSVKVTSPGDGAVVAEAQTITATYDETIDSHSTVKVVNSFGVTIPGSVSVTTTSKTSPSSACPTSNCVLKFVASHSLSAGSYTVTFDAFGVSGGVGGGENVGAYAHNVTTFVVNKTKPAVAPYGVAPDDPAITQANVSKVPFSGWALPGYNVGVAIYDESCDQNCSFPFTDTEGSGVQDGSNHTVVDNCTDDQAHIVTSGGTDYRLCPFTLTVDDSAGCDTDTNEFQCTPAGDPSAVAKNQWYAYSYTAAGQTPAAASPGTDPAILRDTTAPHAPDNTATGYVTNNSPNPGQATVTVSATDAVTAPTGPAAYVVRVSDAFGDSNDVSLTPAGGNLSNRTFPMPSGLYDGNITIAIAAADNLGNTSSFVTASTPGGKSSAKEIVDLATADPATHTDSMTTATGTRDLADLTGASDKASPPTGLTVHFNEPIALTVQDLTVLGDGTPSAHACLIAPGPVPICESSSNELAIPSADPTALTWTPPAGFGDGLPNGVYQVVAFAPAANCATRTDANSGTYSCEHSAGVEGDPTTWPVLATFTIDKAAPTITGLAVTPSTITPSSVKSVQIVGTSDPDTRDVQISIKSSAGGAPLLLDQQVAAPSDPNATSVSWSFFPVDLSTVRDGTLTISAFAIDDAGNKTAAPGSQVTATLRAHRSTLTEKASSSMIVYGQLVAVRGRLVDANGAAIKHATIVVRPRYADGTYGASTKGTTDSTGHWGVLSAPAHNATFYASYAGSTTAPLHDAAAVHTARTGVRVAIAFTSPKNKSTVGSPVVLKGKVAPNKHGKYVSIYRYVRGGNKLLGRARLDSHSHWSFKLSLPRGTVKLFAKIGKTAGNYGNTTSLLTLTH